VASDFGFVPFALQILWLGCKKLKLPCKL
jgi:hypothetical protein